MTAGHPSGSPEPAAPALQRIARDPLPVAILASLTARYAVAATAAAFHACELLFFSVVRELHVAAVREPRDWRAGVVASVVFCLCWLSYRVAVRASTSPRPEGAR